MKKPAGKSGRKNIDGDDHDVWSHTAQSVEPLRKAKGRHHPAADRVQDVAPRMQTKSAGEPAKGKHAPSKQAPVKSEPVKAPAKRPPPIADFDRKNVRKIRSGQVEIEARIDLHGMRQDEAHVALIRFLHRCQSKDQRWVLVITGKGKVTDSDRDAPFDMTVQRERGVLKRNVPRWLDEPDVRPLVVSYTTAAIQHGGEGALYIHLRKSR